MGISYRDVQMLGDSIDSASNSFLRRRQMDRDEEERIRRAILEKKMREDEAAYRSQMLQGQQAERADTAAYRKEQAEAAKARYQSMEEREKRMESKADAAAQSRTQQDAQEAISKFHSWLSDGVKKGVIPAANANATLKQSLQALPPEQRSMLKGTPWENVNGDLFVDPKPEAGMEYAEDPVTGERFAIRGNQTLKSGVNPAKADQMSEAQARAKIKMEKEAARLKEEEDRKEALDKQLAEIAKLKASGATEAKIEDSKTGPVVKPGGWLTFGEKPLSEIEQKVREAYAPKVPQSGTNQIQLPQAPVSTNGMNQATQQRQTGSMHGVARPQSDAEYLRLPKGTRFFNPATGEIRVKK